MFRHEESTGGCLPVDNFRNEKMTRAKLENDFSCLELERNLLLRVLRVNNLYCDRTLSLFMYLCGVQHIDTRN